MHDKIVHGAHWHNKSVTFFIITKLEVLYPTVQSNLQLPPGRFQLHFQRSRDRIKRYNIYGVSYAHPIVYHQFCYRVVRCLHLRGFCYRVVRCVHLRRFCYRVVRCVHLRGFCYRVVRCVHLRRFCYRVVRCVHIREFCYWVVRCVNLRGFC